MKTDYSSSAFVEDENSNELDSQENFP